MPKTSDRIIAHIDMDCFYCACEIKRNPELKGKPVMVGGSSNRGVISAANYEAREYGVFSATPAAKARKLCPNGIFLSGDRKYYKSESNKIMEIFHRISDKMTQVSVDEAYLDLTTYSYSFKSLQEMAQFIQNEIKEKTQLTCSIGIAKSRIVAKIASDYKKPAGITIVDDAKEFLAPLAIKKIPGIGKVTIKKYEKYGILTIGKLAELSEYEVIEKFGNNALDYLRVARGEDVSRIKDRKPIQSISREDTFSKDIFNTNQIKEKILRISKQVHKDLGTKSYRTVSIKIKFSDFSVITRDKSFKTPLNSLEQIEKNALELFDKFVMEEKEKQRTRKAKASYDRGIMLKSLRLIGVKLANLSNEKEIQKTIPKAPEDKNSNN